MLCLGVALFAACGDDAATPLPEDVDSVLELRCRRCHGRPTDNFAPMSMVTWEDMQRESPSGGDPVYEAAAGRLTSRDFPMPPFRSPERDAITDEDRQVIFDWIDAGAPPLEEKEPQ